MRYGHFDDQAREYVIETRHTPYPWINYLGNETMFSLISHQAGGYSFYQDARLRRLTRFQYNATPWDQSGRRLYINDAGEAWSAPRSGEPSEYEARHGLGYSRFRSVKHGLEVLQRFFVPLGYPVELEQVTLTNQTDQTKTLTVFSFREFCHPDAWEDQTNYQRTLSLAEVEVDGSAIYHLTEYRERRSHFTVFWVNQPIVGFDTDLETFTGPWQGLDQPQTVLAGRPGNSIASGWNAIGAHAIALDLDPGQSANLTFGLGYVENPAEAKWEAPGQVHKDRAKALMAAFNTQDQVNTAFDQLRHHWDQTLSHFQVSCQDLELQRMVNTWNQYQCVATFNLSRSASYFESGIGRGMGFRDSNQDLLGVVHLAPARARQRLLDLAATQLPDGSAYHQYQPLTKRGNDQVGSGFNDDPLWLIYATSAYLKETGDFAVLDQPVPFDHDPAQSAPLFEHLVRSYRHVVGNLGPHGLPLIGRADWNDCLNLNCHSTEAGESFQTTGAPFGPVAESVFIAGLFNLTVPDLVDLATRRGQSGLADEMKAAMTAMDQAITDHGWDGAFFRRAYDASGRVVGTMADAEGQVFLEPQGMCVMGGAGWLDGRAHRALDAVAEHLAGPHGLALVAPAFQSYQARLGETTSYPPGYKENGGIFCHANPWVIIAETMVGDTARALDYYRRVNPAVRESIGEVHRLEPYVYAQMIAGPEAPRHGEAKNSWLTGTAAWMFFAASQYLLGVRTGFDGLVIDPKVPASFGDYQVVRRFRGAEYRIKVVAPGGSGSLVVDGQPLSGSLVPLAPPGAVVDVAWTGNG